MNNTRETIPVFFSIDNNYVPLFSVSIDSLLDNASDAYDYKIIVLHQNVTEENQARLKRLARKGAEIEFVSMQDKIEGISDNMNNRLRCDYFTLTIYFRLFIPTMFPEYDKGIYLDSDIVVPGDISELYHIDLGDNLIGACKDFSIHGIPELVNYIDRAVGPGKDKYVNSGVLLMDLKKLREAQLDERFMELLTKYHFDTIAPDQDYLNVLCYDKIFYLDPCWNSMPNNYSQELADPKLIHFNLFFKPWGYDNIQYESYFWKYAETSGYLEELREHKHSYTQEQKDSDNACLANLIRLGVEYAEKSFNFRTVFESGEEKRLVW